MKNNNHLGEFPTGGELVAIICPYQAPKRQLLMNNYSSKLWFAGISMRMQKVLNKYGENCWFTMVKVTHRKKQETIQENGFMIHLSPNFQECRFHLVLQPPQKLLEAKGVTRNETHVFRFSEKTTWNNQNRCVNLKGFLKEMSGPLLLGGS